MTVWKSPCWPGKGSQHKFHPRCPRGNCALWLCLPRWALCQERLHSSSLAKPLGKQGIARPDQIITWTALLDSWLVVMKFHKHPLHKLALAQTHNSASHVRNGAGQPPYSTRSQTDSSWFAFQCKLSWYSELPALEWPNPNHPLQRTNSSMYTFGA